MSENNVYKFSSNYVVNRLNNQIKYYDSKSIKYKKWYYRFQSISILISAIIPFLSGFVLRCHIILYIISFLASLVVIIQGLLSLTRFRSNWISYRMNCENLKTERIEYKYHCGKYSNLDGKNRLRLLVEVCETIMNNEHNKWDFERHLKNKKE